MIQHVCRPFSPSYHPVINNHENSKTRHWTSTIGKQTFYLFSPFTYFHFLMLQNYIIFANFFSVSLETWLISTWDPFQNLKKHSITLHIFTIVTLNFFFLLWLYAIFFFSSTFTFHIFVHRGRTVKCLTSSNDNAELNLFVANLSHLWPKSWRMHFSICSNCGKVEAFRRGWTSNEITCERAQINQNKKQLIVISEWICEILIHSYRLSHRVALLWSLLDVSWAVGENISLFSCNMHTNIMTMMIIWVETKVFH